MKIDKAIEILVHLERVLAPTMAAGGTDAIQLGIQALKAVEAARTNNYWTPIPTLLGETAE